MQVGHTSGMDAVTGLLIGLVAWEVQSPVISYGSGAGGIEHGSIKNMKRLALEHQLPNATSEDFQCHIKDEASKARELHYVLMVHQT